MATSTIIFGFLNLVMGVGLVSLWVRSTRPQKEDPRLSRGLQLLQSKIAVLEDLSDRTDTQVKQLIQILEERAKGLSNKILQAQELLGTIDQSMAQSREVANIFQDKIPHEEIIERQNASKYVQAAKMAHEGVSNSDISRRLNIPLSEVEFIAKVNKNELSFAPEALPKWAQGNTIDEQMVERVFHAKVPDLSGLTQVTHNFNQVVGEAKKVEADELKRQQQAADRRRSLEQRQKEILASAKSMTSHVTKSVMEAAEKVIHDVAETAKPAVRRVQFPRIDSPDGY